MERENEMRKVLHLIITIVVGISVLAATALIAEEPLPSQDAVLSQVEQLENLRQSNPAAYRQWVENKKAELRQQFQKMNGERQTQFKQFIQGQRNRRFERLRHFRQQRPEAFQRFMNNRMQRWQQMAQKNPRIKEKAAGPRAGLNRAPKVEGGRNPAGYRRNPGTVNRAPKAGGQARGGRLGGRRR